MHKKKVLHFSFIFFFYFLFFEKKEKNPVLYLIMYSLNIGYSTSCNAELFEFS